MHIKYGLESSDGQVTGKYRVTLMIATKGNELFGAVFGIE
jgi:hypothetical protein